MTQVSVTSVHFCLELSDMRPVCGLIFGSLNGQFPAQLLYRSLFLTQT